MDFGFSSHSSLLVQLLFYLSHVEVPNEILLHGVKQYELRISLFVVEHIQGIVALRMSNILQHVPRRRIATQRFREITSRPFIHGHKTSGILTSRFSSSHPFSRIAANTRGTAMAVPFTV